MNLVLSFLAPLGACALALAACSSDKSVDETAPPALQNYAANLYGMYGAAVTDHEAFTAKVEAFLAAPTEATLTTAREGWLASRANYMLTEGARFYDGPIDSDPPNHEAALNSWPLDEAYVDYTTDGTGKVNDTVGIINNPSMLATIDVDGIDALNAKGGDTNISNGYHAIEFLLWGQALMPVGPGTRAATDFVPGGPHPNVERRIAFMRAALASVKAHLVAVRDAWAPAAAYRTEFVAGGGKSVALVLTGLGKFSKGEMASQRVDAPYASKSRRDQHDCFSSLTLTDYVRDAEGVVALYTGAYGGQDGPGIDELVTAKDAALGARILAAVQKSVADMKAIPTPFEASIAGDDSSAGRSAIRTVVASLRAQGDLMADAASALGLSVTVPDEN